MAPEVLKGQGHNAAADLWSLGMCIWEMLVSESMSRAPLHPHLMSSYPPQRAPYPTLPLIHVHSPSSRQPTF
jgi:serine/threonine protein kinase